ncbi:uncharacterized protein LOC111643531 [Copidosoma floridanum]|uniref:uncharacterized protein LOC111643531 n=1 Tax=Copidosoma floridanum TaxID=29053 RepID=UPI000C6F7DFD|nr:uncharacterized protein LOC111643531 [Copidosoma floridanum]
MQRQIGANLRAHNFLDETPFYKAVAMLYKNMSATKNEVKMMLAKITGVHVTQDNFEEIVSEVPVAVKNLTYILTPGYDESVLKLHELIIAIAISNEQLVDRLLEIDRLPLESKNYCCEDVNVALFAAVDKNNYNIIKMLLKAGLRTNRYHGKLFLAIGLWTEQKLSMICLFWEFKDYLTFCYIMKQTIHEFFTGNYGPKKLLELLIFYFAIDLRLNTLYEELIPLKGLFKLDSKSENILTSCNSKLDELKEKKIGIKSMFDLLMMPLDSLIELLNNPDYLDACQKIFSALDNKTVLEYYEYAIKTRLDLAIEKRQLMDVAKDCLNWALQDILIPMKIYTLDYHITWKILSYLTMRDLERIAKNYLKK